MKTMDRQSMRNNRFLHFNTDYDSPRLFIRYGLNFKNLNNEQQPKMNKIPTFGKIMINS